MRQWQVFLAAIITLLLLYQILNVNETPLESLDSLEHFVASKKSPQCVRSGLKTSVVGLMVTKDDGPILEEWLDYNMPSLKALVIFDSGSDDYVKNTVQSYQHKCEDANIHVIYERDFDPLPYQGDQMMRYHPHRYIKETFGEHNWIMICHSDEFFYHEPELIVQKLLDEEPKCNSLFWNAPQVLPHPLEYERWHYNNEMKTTELAQTKFQYLRYYCPGHGQVVREGRLFHDSPNISYSLEEKARGTLPQGLSKPCKDVGATYIHYKVVDPDLDHYDASGRHTKHWQGKNAPPVGTGFQVSKNSDFFVSQFRTCTATTAFDGCMTSSVHGFSPSSEEYRVDRIWPVHNGRTNCVKNENNEKLKSSRMSGCKGRLVSDVIRSRFSECENLLSIIIPTYEDHVRLQNQINVFSNASESLSGVVSLIVVDDGSTSLKAMDLFQNLKHFPLDITVLEILVDIPWNQPGAKNLGAAYARSKWLLFLDLDTILPIPSISALVNELSNQKIIKNEKKIAFHFKRHNLKGIDHVRVHPSVVLIRSTIFWKVIGGFDENFSGNYGHEDSLMKFQFDHSHIKFKPFENNIDIVQFDMAPSMLSRDSSQNEKLLEKSIQYRSIKNYKKKLFHNCIARFQWKIGLSLPRSDSTCAMRKKSLSSVYSHELSELTKDRNKWRKMSEVGLVDLPEEKPPPSTATSTSPPESSTSKPSSPFSPSKFSQKLRKQKHFGGHETYHRKPKKETRQKLHF